MAATTIASSSIVNTVDLGSFGPVGRSATELRFFQGKSRGARLTLLLTVPATQPRAGV